MKRGEVFEGCRGLRKPLKRRGVQDTEAVVKSQRLYRPVVLLARGAKRYERAPPPRPSREAQARDLAWSR